MDRPLPPHFLLRMAGLSALPALVPMLLHWAMQGEFSVAAAGSGWLLAVATLLGSVGELTLLQPTAKGWTARWPLLARPFLMLVILAIGYFATGSTLLAWGLICLLWVACITVGIVSVAQRPRWLQTLVVLLLLGFATTIPSILTQIETQFAEEEFFVVLQMAGLFPYLCLLALAWVQLKYRPVLVAKLPLRRLAIGLTLLAGVGAGGIWWAYAHSFYPAQAPAYPGITEAAPFLCNDLTQPPSVNVPLTGAAVFDELLTRMAENPNAGTAEFGMLALGWKDAAWADKFRAGLLAEASAGRFTDPAHSVKSVQYDAALRVYFFDKVRQAFPELLTQADRGILQSWFAAINRRALTVEWVDVLYALALGKWPEGPYENQEIGAGLLALLESTNLADPALRVQNRAYLDRNPRGWQARFRNTDDSFYYQRPWITDAYFQSIYTNASTKASDDQKRSQSFEWLLLQMLPDGNAPHYNHVVKPSMAGIAYLGASLLGDERYLWLAHQTLAADRANSVYPLAQPGIIQPAPISVQSAPPQGSCLIYGDSGLPNQIGPLAPDKIVFRDGWGSDSHYLLLNLRFTGWHRYRATNAISLVYAGSPVVREVLDQPPYRWLPAGRSLFRDRRIPRQNLNGILIENSGLSKALTSLTAIGSLWAQDPPYYAQILDFATDADVERSHTALRDWHGWQHDRWIDFYHRGPIVVVDQAVGPPFRQAALTWNFVERPQDISQTNNKRMQIGSGDDGLEVLFLTIGEKQSIQDYFFDFAQQPAEGLLIAAPTPGYLGVATIFLSAEWRGAQATVQESNGTKEIVIDNGSTTLRVPIRH